MHTEETKKKISETLKRKYRTGEKKRYWLDKHRSAVTKKSISIKLSNRRLKESTKQLIAEANTGKHPTQEIKDKIANTLKGKYKTGELTNAFKNKKHTKESRQKMSVSLSGRKRQPCSEETKKKISLSNKGKHYYSKEVIDTIKATKALNPQIPWNTGLTTETDERVRELTEKMALSLKNKSHTDEHNNHISEAHKLLWQDPKFVKKQMQARRIKPTKPELQFKSILDKLFPNEYRYVGDGEFTIGRKCPDFVNVNGQKKLLELYGTYWHKGQDPQDRIDLFKKYGYDTLVIWQDELKDTGILESRLKEFHHRTVVCLPS